MDELDIQHFGSISTFGYTQPHCKYKNCWPELNNKVTIEVEIGEKKVGSKLSFFPLQILARIPASMKRVQKYLLTRLKLNFENKTKKRVSSDFFSKVYKKIKEFETRLTEGLGICLTANSRRHRNPDNDNGGANGSQHHLHAPITANRSLRHSRTLSASDENESRGVGGTGRRNHASGGEWRIEKL